MTRRPVALDLFCCGGGAAAGLAAAGFDVIGFDVKPSKNYPFPVFHADALEADLSIADFVWASPPCQAHISGLNAVNEKRYGKASVTYDCFIERTRALLRASGKPYVIENVPGAPLEVSCVLDGHMFGLGIVRRRHFECSWTPLTPQAPIRHRRPGAGMVRYGREHVPRDVMRAALGIPHFVSEYEARQAIPPAYAEYLARQALQLGYVA